MTIPDRANPQPLRAAAWMMGSIAAFTGMAIAARSIQSAHDTFEILGFRSLLGVGLVLLLATASGRTGRIATRRLPSHALRSVVHFTGQALWFWALTQIPLAQVFALEFTSPLWVILLAPLFLGERQTRSRLVAAGIGFCGILLVANPDFSRLELGVLAAALSAVFFASSVMLTKALTRGEDLFAILFWMCLLQSGLGLGLALWDGEIRWPTSASLPWLALIGLAGVGAHLCLTRALQLAPASFVGPIDFVRLPLIALIGVGFYDERLPWTLALGAGLILAANLLSIRAEALRAKETPAQN
ncbi:DMT family transporter [Xinfangfangia sp. CPCC 101601]|uniref:DMT family transporter n=2 Tax=Pseudogemmobacter lacusdianii TaxID=3069608 RepID=A0ABU0VX30_9RHOB|nr:DMT family transporter [Xinfangfangia sp. CPCC 101601]MDQ2065460.1 DMT family transporter [Xinfangfangia sp. CPCC 101601]